MKHSDVLEKIQTFTFDKVEDIIVLTTVVNACYACGIPIVTIYQRTTGREVITGGTFLEITFVSDKFSLGRALVYVGEGECGLNVKGSIHTFNLTVDTTEEMVKDILMSFRDNPSG